MVEDGLMERFGIQEVYGMHNMPGLPVGDFAIRPGPMLAASDLFTIEVTGRGGHAAQPHNTIDPVVAASAIVLALQSIVARNVDPLKAAVVSVTSFRTESDAFNVIPERVELRGTAARARARGPGPDRGAHAPPSSRRPPAPTAPRRASTYERNYPVTVNAGRPDRLRRAGRRRGGRRAARRRRRRRR